MPGWTTDVAVGASALEPFPGEDRREWEIVTTSEAAARQMAKRFDVSMVFGDKTPNGWTRYVLCRGLGLDHAQAVARVAEFNEEWGTAAFDKRPCA